MFALLSVLACQMGGPVAAQGPPGAAAHSAASVYSVGIIPFYGPEKIWALYSPFIDHLNRTTTIAWELKLYPNHESMLEDICSGRLSIALFGPVPLGRAMKKCGVEPIVVALDSDGRTTYRSIMLTGDRTIRMLADLKGRKVALFRGSTASHIFPLKMLKDAGVTPDMVQPVFYEGQVRIMNAVLQNEVSAGGVKEGLYRRFRQAGRLRVLKRSSNLPNFAFCSAPSLDRGVKRTFTELLLKLSPRKRKKDREAMRGWDDEIRNGFTAPTKAFRKSVEEVNRVYEEFAHEIR